MFSFKKREICIDHDEPILRFDGLENISSTYGLVFKRISSSSVVDDC
jgi:hypothetical protein